jgi:S-(hydroxymethyl)glutathione dehydrogenase/alcohol dehydrogenase
MWKNRTFQVMNNRKSWYEAEYRELLDLLKIPIVGCRIPTGWGAVVNNAKATQGCTALVVGLGGVGFNVIQGLKSVGAVVIIAADIHESEEMGWNY